MTTVLIRRPAPLELAVPADDDAPLVVAAPPQQTEQPGGSANVATIVMPLVSGSGSLLITLTNQDRPLFAAAGLLFMVVSVGLGIVLFVGTRSSARRRQRDNRERYLDYLEGIRRAARRAAARQRARSARRHPEPDVLLDVARRADRRWERRPADPDFLSLRVGTGSAALAGGLSLPVDRSNPLISYDPVCLSAAQALVDRYATLTEQPITVPLAGVGCLSIVGNRGTGRALARAVIGQLVTMHPADDVRVAVVRAPALAALWEWVKWLPHNLRDPSVIDPGAKPGPPAVDVLVCGSFAELQARISADLDVRCVEAERRRGRPAGQGLRHLVVVVDGEFQYGAPHLDISPSASLSELGIHLISVVAHRREEPEQVDLRITLAPQASIDATDGPPRASALLEGRGCADPGRRLQIVDAVGVPSVTALARSMSALRLSEDDLSAVATSTIGLRDILGVSDVAQLDPRRSWLPGSARDFLRVPVGLGARGSPVHLDLKESARGGMGPHGLVVGATGSGKSELLRTMVTSLVIAHSPDRLALLLVDFKGGATFAGFAGLPHLAGMVTNLAADPGLVQRFRDALYGELTRRQRVLSEAGNLANLHDYAELVAHGGAHGGAHGLEPMPHLLVIIDEFTELLAARPDFAELFLAVGRIGRSIGIHLLLATQRLDAGKIRGLESHLSYRIGLRTFSEAESREALGVPDAYHLPAEPGAGYLKVDTTVFERFKAALVSTPYRGPASEVGQSAPIVEFSTTPDRNLSAGPGAARAGEPSTSVGEEPPRSPATNPTILDIAVRRLASSGEAPARQVWIAPLPRALALDLVPGGAASAAEDPRKPLETALSAVLGLQDIPEQQQQVPLEWDFAGAQGNVLIVGAALSGKSVLLRTMICSLALRYPPGEVALYCVDYGGGSLTSLAELPQVAGVSTRSDPDRVRRTVSDVLVMLDVREALLGRHGLDGAEGLRRARRLGRLSSGVLGDVFLVVDGWAALREAEPDLEDQVMTIAHRGPSLGVHTVLSASTSSQVRMRLATALPGRIELRLTDSFDSAIDRRRADAVPADIPGRALVPDGDFAQIALPRIDGRPDLDDLSAAVAQLVGEVHERWPASSVTPVRVLPSILSLTDLLAPAEPDESCRTDPRLDAGSGAGSGVAIGVSERDLAPVTLDLFGMDPHLQVYGEAQSGKSTFLRTLLRQLLRTRSPDDLGIVLVDYRRAHLDLVGADHLLAYCTSAAATRSAVAEICQGVTQRLPGPGVTSAQLRARNWWTGRQIVTIVDDYDLVSAGAGNPLAGLAEFLAQGADVGLHVVTARRTGGASRAMFEPVTQALTDLGGPGLLFSGDRTEGRLVAGVASMRLPQGRALLARRGRPPEQVQIAWSEPA